MTDTRQVDQWGAVGDNHGLMGVVQVRSFGSAASSRLNSLISLGAAHGWTGILLAELVWHRARRAPLPTSALDKAIALAALAGPVARASKPAEFSGGWCRGNGGALALWSAALELTGEPAFLRAGNITARVAVGNRPDSPSLCCGAVGQAYGFLAWYRVTGESRWLRRARWFADHAVRQQPRHTPHLPHPDSLFAGRMGTVLLPADLEQPTGARIPVMEWKKPLARTASVLPPLWSRIVARRTFTTLNIRGGTDGKVLQCRLLQGELGFFPLLSRASSTTALGSHEFPFVTHRDRSNCGHRTL